MLRKKEKKDERELLLRFGLEMMRESSVYIGGRLKERGLMWTAAFKWKEPSQLSFPSS